MQERDPKDLWRVEDVSPRYLFFVATFVILWSLATSILLMLLIGSFIPPVFGIVHGITMWFYLPKVNAWLVQNTPFKKVWNWANE